MCSYTEPAVRATSQFAGLSLGNYRAIAVDPPTHFKARTTLQVVNWSSRRDVEKHYSTLSFKQLVALPIATLAAPSGCHLFVWTSDPHLTKACELIERWGFRYSTRAFTWVKLQRRHDSSELTEFDLHVGLGATMRHQTELVLLGRRGNCRRIAKGVREVILTPVREHSRKPDEFYRRVERYEGPHLVTFDFEVGGLCYTATVSRFPDGRLGEIFLGNHKSSSAADANASDAAIVCSIALQHGADPEVIRRALCRNGDGRASGPLAAALDIIAGGDHA